MSFFPKLEDYKNIDSITIKSGPLSKTLEGWDARSFLLREDKRKLGKFLVIVTGFILYLFYEYIIKPINSAYEYLGQFSIKMLSEGEAFPPIPAFYNILVMTIIAYLLMWTLSFFKKFPNYASRSILIFCLAFILAFKGPNFDIRIIGPLASGYDEPGMIFLLLPAYAILSWLLFIVVRFFRFRSLDRNTQSQKKETRSSQNEEKWVRERIAISSFLHRKVNLGFVFVIAILAIFEPNFWPDVTFESRFWAGTEYNPNHHTQEDLYYANLNADSNIILRTIASYLFLLFLVFTLQVRSAVSMRWMVGFSGYIPAKNVFFIAFSGAFCAAVFAFTPYEYPGDESQIWKITLPVLFIGFSLFRTGRQYYRFLKLVDMHSFR